MAYESLGNKVIRGAVSDSGGSLGRCIYDAHGSWMEEDSTTRWPWLVRAHEDSSDALRAACGGDTGLMERPYMRLMVDRQHRSYAGLTGTRSITPTLVSMKTGSKVPALNHRDDEVRKTTEATIQRLWVGALGKERILASRE